MDITLDHIVALACGRLPATEAAAVRAAIAQSAELRAAFDRLGFAARTIEADTRDPVPADATDAAKRLGRRLESLRAPSLAERIDGAIRSLVGRLVFDSRLDGPIVGLRGGTGFVVSYEVDGPAGRTDIDLECAPAGPTTATAASAASSFDLVGMATGIRGGTLNAVADDGTGQRFETVIDEHGMFRMRLAAGTYRLRLTPSNASAEPIELPTLELP